MGCGKSKHDVVTGNTSRIRKPSEAESVNGKESESMKRQGTCSCRKTKDVSAVVSADQPETTDENIAKKPEENEAGGDCRKQKAEETKSDIKQEEKVTTISPQANFATEEKETVHSPAVKEMVPENVVTKNEKETTSSLPVMEETVNNVNKTVLPEKIV